jgi:hypothetical protein
MDEAIEDLIESGQRLRVHATWLAAPIEGHVDTRLWHADPYTFFLETDDGEVYAIERTDPSLQVALVEEP